MKFRPLGDRILVLPLDQTHTIEGFQLPDSAVEKEAQLGIVVSVGPRTVEGLKTGDKVVFGAYAGIEILVNGEAFMQMREGEVMGVLEETPEFEFRGAKLFHKCGQEVEVLDCIDNGKSRKWNVSCVRCTTRTTLDQDSVDKLMSARK